MLNEVLNDLNNYFFQYTLGLKKNSYSKDVTFTATDTMEADFTDTFIVGEYVLIEGSRLNDGVYLISAIDDTSITIDTTVDITISTEAEISCTITKLYIPKSFIALLAEIKAFNSGSTTGLSSESQGSRSISYSGDSSWKMAFKNRLSQYRKLGW